VEAEGQGDEQYGFCFEYYLGCIKSVISSSGLSALIFLEGDQIF